MPSLSGVDSRCSEQLAEIAPEMAAEVRSLIVEWKAGSVELRAAYPVEARLLARGLAGTEGLPVKIVRVHGVWLSRICNARTRQTLLKKASDLTGWIVHARRLPPSKDHRAAISRARGSPRTKVSSACRWQANQERPRCILSRGRRPDSHGCFIDGAALNAFLGDLEAIKPAEVIMLGDHLDCGGFLAQHQTIGFVAESDYSYAEDVAACNQFLDAIRSECLPQ